LASIIQLYEDARSSEFQTSIYDVKRIACAVFTGNISIFY